MVRDNFILVKILKNISLKSFHVVIFFLLLSATDLSELHAFETGDDFVPHNIASRFMMRYEQMGNNEHITYPARVFDMEVTDAQAEVILDHLSVVVSYMTESMYNHYGFMVKSVTFTLEANGEGPSTAGDPMPLNIQLGVWWGMGYANNWLGVTEDWVLNPDYTDSGLFHEFSHHFLLRHLDLNDGYFPRSTMDTPGGDVPTDYLRWGGDDLVGAIHMWRFTDEHDSPRCPEFYTLETVGVTGDSFPDAVAYPEGTWRCDPDRENRHGMQLQNIDDGRCLEVLDSNNGTNISMNVCNKEDIKQQWDLVADDDGAFRIRNADNGKCLQIRGGSLSSGTIIEQDVCNAANSDDATQKFYPIDDGNGNYSLRAELSGKFIEVSGDSVIQENPNGANIQRWNISSDIHTHVDADADADVARDAESDTDIDRSRGDSDTTGCGCFSVGKSRQGGILTLLLLIF